MNEGTFRKSIITDGRTDRRGRLMSLIISERVDILSVYESVCFALSRHSMSMKLRSLALAFAVWVTSASIDRASHKRRSLLAELPTHRKKQKSLSHWLSILRERKWYYATSWYVYHHKTCKCWSTFFSSNFRASIGVFMGWLIASTSLHIHKQKAERSIARLSCSGKRTEYAPYQGSPRRRDIGQICHPVSKLAGVRVCPDWNDAKTRRKTKQYKEVEGNDWKRCLTLSVLLPESQLSFMAAHAYSPTRRPGLNSCKGSPPPGSTFRDNATGIKSLQSFSLQQVAT